jgi:HEAT repeats
MFPMDRKVFWAGVVLIAVGTAMKTLPHVVTGLSLMSVAQVVGLGLLFYVSRKRWALVRAWVKQAPAGKHTALVLGFLVLIGLAMLVFSVIGEIETGRKYDRVAVDLKGGDPVYAPRLAVHLTGDVSAPLRKRIVDRIGELGNPSEEVVGKLRQLVRTDEDGSVRRAAADALGKLMTSEQVLKAVFELPDLEPDTRALFIVALEQRTGQKFGDNVNAWGDWVVLRWTGEDGDAAYRLALAAWQTHPGRASIRDACLARLTDPEGVSRETLKAALENEASGLRAAAATAIGRTGQKDWASDLESALRAEKDGTAAAAMAAALLDADPMHAGLTLVAIVRGSDSEAVKVAALAQLQRRYGAASGEDLSAVVYAIRKSLPAGAEKSRALKLLKDMARESLPARVGLRRILDDPAEHALDRGQALDILLKVDGESLSDLDLVSLIEKPPSADFAQKIRGELKRRCPGKDGGRDAAAWREILEAE